PVRAITCVKIDVGDSARRIRDGRLQRKRACSLPISREGDHGGTGSSRIPTHLKLARGGFAGERFVVAGVIPGERPESITPVSLGGRVGEGEGSRRIAGDR